VGEGGQARELAIETIAFSAGLKPTGHADRPIRKGVADPVAFVGRYFVGYGVAGTEH